MAQLLLSGKELVELLKNSMPLPSQVKAVNARGKDIVFTMSLSSILPNFTLTLSFREYKAGAAFFTVSSNAFIELMIKIFKMPQPDFISITHPILRIDINKAFAEKIPDLKIDDISFDNDQYRISLNSIPGFN